MTQKFAIYAGIIAAALAGSAPALAQVVPAYPPVAAFPPHEVVALVRSAGLEPVTRPVRNGPAYVLQAVNPAGREVRVIVDIRLRRIARVVPLGPRVAAAGVPSLPPPYARPPAEVAAVPDGYGPAGRVTGLSADVDPAPYGADPAAPYGPATGNPATGNTALPAAPGRAPSAAAAPTRASPPLPRPRPKLAAAEPVAPAAAAPQASGTNGASKPAAPAASATPPAVAPEPVYEQHE